MTSSEMVSTALLGVLGAGIVEVIRVVAALRAGVAPNAHQYMASVLSALLGLGVLFFDTAGSQALQTAVLGAAFPQIFSGLVAAAKPPEAGFRSASTARQRSVIDYLAWRL